MSFLNPIFRGISIEAPPYLSGAGICARAMLAGLPLISFILLAIFIVLGTSVKDVVDRAVVRNAQMQARTMAFALERVLDDARDNLLLLASGGIDREKLEQWLKYQAQIGDNDFCEAAFLGVDPGQRFIFLNLDGQVIDVPPAAARVAQGAPLEEQARTKAREDIGVGISRPMDVIYPMLPVNHTARNVALKVLRFYTPVYGGDHSFMGILSLSLDLRVLRDRMSTISQVEGNNSGLGFFFDEDGWMIFQSEAEASRNEPLSADLARTGLRGDFGRSGFKDAFRPDAAHLNYWTMVADVQNRRSGVLPESITADIASAESGDSGGVSYAPVIFHSGPGRRARVAGGVALLDDDYSPLASGNRIFGMFLLSFMIALASLGFFLWLYARLYARNIKIFCRQLQSREAANCAEPLPEADQPREFCQLREAVNAILKKLEIAAAARKSHAAARNRQWLRSAAINLPALPELRASCLVGESPPMLALYDQIGKAAQTSADVLVIGETGTGKELVASAIHKLSDRSEAPFISINCGALDESLLMDTLFGHVKGAFTEARGERKGAFLAAGGGTLLLDEIGNAPPRLQQALLRALSTRSIRPLGSDADIPFNTRVIAATNASLHAEGQDFRADLYHRLAVIKIITPPLRNRMEDVPLLLVYFLAQAAEERGTGMPAISHGALEKLKAHDWPGNVRELKNVITSAVAFFDGKLIQAQDLQIENAVDVYTAQNAPRINPDPVQDFSGGESARFARLNARQRTLLNALTEGGSISRQEYQRMAGEEISSRTAQYDLRFMVGLGLIQPLGRGPSQRYAAIIQRPRRPNIPPAARR